MCGRVGLCDGGSRSPDYTDDSGSAPQLLGQITALAVMVVGIFWLMVFALSVWAHFVVKDKSVFNKHAMRRVLLYTTAVFAAAILLDIYVRYAR